MINALVSDDVMEKEKAENIYGDISKLDSSIIDFGEVR